MEAAGDFIDPGGRVVDTNSQVMEDERGESSEIGEMLARVRREAGLKQDEVAKRIGVTRDTLSRFPGPGVLPAVQTGSPGWNKPPGCSLL